MRCSSTWAQRPPGIPLWAAPRGRFGDWWAALRYYACWIFASAFLFKIFRGTALSWEDGVRTVRANFALFFYQHPEWVWTRFVGCWLRHPALLNAGYKLFILLEGLFIAGFLTRRLDPFLAWSAAVLILSTLLFADVNFLEMGAMIFVFFPAKTWSRISLRSEHSST